MNEFASVIKQNQKHFNTNRDNPWIRARSADSIASSTPSENALVLDGKFPRKTRGRSSNPTNRYDIQRKSEIVSSTHGNVLNDQTHSNTLGITSYQDRFEGLSAKTVTVTDTATSTVPNRSGAMTPKAQDNIVLNSAIAQSSWGSGSHRPPTMDPNKEEKGGAAHVASPVRGPADPIENINRFVNNAQTFVPAGHREGGVPPGDHEMATRDSHNDRQICFETQLGIVSDGLQGRTNKPHSTILPTDHPNAHNAGDWTPAGSQNIQTETNMGQPPLTGQAGGNPSRPAQV